MDRRDVSLSPVVAESKWYMGELDAGFGANSFGDGVGVVAHQRFRFGFDHDATESFGALSLRDGWAPPLSFFPEDGAAGSALPVRVCRLSTLEFDACCESDGLGPNSDTAVAVFPGEQPTLSH